VIWAAFPPLIGKNLQRNNKQKLAGNAAKHTQNVKKFLFLHRIFLHRNLQIKVDIIDLSMNVRN
jgi:hypothetical protein